MKIGAVTGRAVKAAPAKNALLAGEPDSDDPALYFSRGAKVRKIEDRKVKKILVAVWRDQVPYRTVADRFGVSLSTVAKLVRESVPRLTKKTVDIQNKVSRR